MIFKSYRDIKENGESFMVIRPTVKLSAKSGSRIADHAGVVPSGSGPDRVPCSIREVRIKVKCTE